MYTLRVKFCDFWDGFDPQDNYFVRLLSPHYYLVHSDTPDYVFFSVYGEEHKQYPFATKILYTGENRRPCFDDKDHSKDFIGRYPEYCPKADWAFSFDYSMHPRNYRLPLYAVECSPPAHRGDALAQLCACWTRYPVRKTKFCAFIVGNPEATKRIEFFNLLSRYKPVDSVGSVCNNYGRIVSRAEKINFLRDYKFVIAFENSSYPGYTTEKIADAFLAHCVPIYWGNPLVDRDFNEDAFINVHSYASMEAVVNRVLLLDSMDSAYAATLGTCPFVKGKPERYARPENVLARFREIFGC